MSSFTVGEIDIGALGDQYRATEHGFAERAGALSEHAFHFLSPDYDEPGGGEEKKAAAQGAAAAKPPQGAPEKGKADRKSAEAKRR